MTDLNPIVIYCTPIGCFLIIYASLFCYRCNKQNNNHVNNNHVNNNHTNNAANEIVSKLLHECTDKCNVLQQKNIPPLNCICCICIEPYLSDDDNIVVELNICGHIFHEKCMNDLITSNPKTYLCPLCRSPFCYKDCKTKSRNGSMEIDF